MKQARGDLLFRIGIFLLPFENFFFAPSRGWGAIAPIVFLAYGILHFRDVLRLGPEIRKILLVLGGVSAATSLNYLVFPPQLGNVIDAFRALALGIAFLVALVIHFELRAGSVASTLRLLTVAYAVSLGVGVVQFVAVRLGLDPLIAAHDAISKRSTLGIGRIQFTFTEPSFLSMHVYGVLLPLLVFFRYRPESRRLRWVFAGFVLAGLVAVPSVRFVADTAAVAVLGLVFHLRRMSARGWVVAGLASVVVGGSLIFALHDHPRVRRIVTSGVYGDASLASRFFRIDASLRGYAMRPVSFVTGHGLGNASVPFRRGYEEAKDLFRKKRSVYREIRLLAREDTFTPYCMPIRIVSEAGILVLGALLFALFDPRRLFLFAAMLWIYLQFDSYAFYTVWLYLFFVKIAPRSEEAP
jgi:hypothetical protein